MTTWGGGGKWSFGVNNNKASRRINAKLSWFWANREGNTREEGINNSRQVPR